METNKLANENEENTNENANSAYSGSGGMQPGGSTGEAGHLNDYDQKGDNQDTSEEQTSGKSIAEATDPSKLSDI